MALKERTEEELLDWFKANPMLYNKKDKDYKLSEKNAMRAEKAEEHGLTLEQLDT